MKRIINHNEKQELEDLYQYYLSHPLICRMKEIPMHRGSNCYFHSFKVAKLAIKRASRHQNYNLKNVLIASILHDYYLYDWRKQKDKKRNHAFKHPFVSASNAVKDFAIDDDVKKIIETHMWPITLKSIPKTKEAWIVNSSDTFVATIEAFSCISMKKKRKAKYVQKISKLY